MIIFFVGPIFGKINETFERISKLSNKLRITPSWIVQCGDFGAFPNPDYVDRSMRIRGGIGDFPKLYLEQTTIRYPTLFIPGVHEDHRWLNFKASRNEKEILPNLHMLLNGFSTNIGVSVVGLGKGYSPKYYKDPANRSKKLWKYYTIDDVSRAKRHSRPDIFISYTAPNKVNFGKFQSNTQGITEIIETLNPRITIHSRFNVSKTYEIGTNKIISLANYEIRPMLFSETEIADLK